jgi:DNA-binding transcriptional LysR family regulator
VSIESLDLELLRTLHLVIAERSVVGAARRLHVTASAVSNSLARLRELLGDPLVTRKGRGIVPTPRAAELAPAIARALHDLDAAVSGTRFEPAACTRRFTLAIADAGQVTYAPAIARRMARELPKAPLRIVGIESLVALGDLASGEIDVHVGVRGTGPGLHHEPLFAEPTVLIARRRHPALRGRHAAATLRHVQVELVPGRGLRDPFAEAYRRAGVHREVVMTVPTFSAAMAVVAGTDLVATVPASLAALSANRVSVVSGAPRSAVALALSWHERTDRDPASIAFRAVVKTAMLADR